MVPVLNCLGVNDSPKREVLQEVSLHLEGQDSEREESPKYSGSPQAPDDLKGDENKILILLRGFCYAQNWENGGLACTPSHILSAKLPVSILALVFTALLFLPLTTVNLLLPQFFLSPPLPFLFTSLSPFPHRKHFLLLFIFSKIIWTHLKLRFFLPKSWEEKT